MKYLRLLLAGVLVALLAAGVVKLSQEI